MSVYKNRYVSEERYVYGMFYHPHLGSILFGDDAIADKQIPSILASMTKHTWPSVIIGNAYTNSLCHAGKGL